MAGERLYSEFQDDKGTDWRVSIYDTNATWNAANKQSFTLGSEGFVLRYMGNNEQGHQPVIGSEVTFTLFEEISLHTSTLDLLYSDSEGRLLLEVYRDPDGDNTIYWRGVLLAEQVERNDEPTPTAVSLTASDDLGNLKDVDFDLNLGDTGAGLNIKNHVLRCLGGLRTLARFGSGQVMLRYLNDTELHAADDDTDPLATIIGQIPQRIDEDGTNQPYSAYDILDSLATCFNARVFLSEGVFWFWPINAHKRLSDAEVLGSKVKQYDKTGTAVTFTAADQIAFNNAAQQDSGTDYIKLAGHVFTHLPPVKSVERTRRFNGNQYVVRGNDDTVITTGTNISLSDTDRTYEIGSKFRVYGSLEFQVSPDVSFAFGLPESRVHIEVEVMLNADAKYYQPEEWTTDSADRYVIDVASFDRSNGTNTVTSYSFITDALPTEEDGLDVTAVVKFFNEEGTNVTSSYTSDDFFIDLGVEVIDENGSNSDLLTYRATHDSDNVLVVDQGEVLFGDNIAFSAQGKLYAFDASLNRVEDEWKSTQTTGPLPLHRLGTNEALSRQKYATKIHRGTVYGLIEMWHTMVEDSDYYLPFELTTIMNQRETMVERYKIAYDSSGITSADDEPRSDGRYRDGERDLITGIVSTITQQVQQPKLGSGSGPVAPTGGRAIQLSDVQGPVRHRVQQIDHTSGSSYIIAADGYDYVFMNAYTDSANGFGGITLPKVADSEGRVLKFKTDDSVAANKYVKLGIDSNDYADGVRIDGEDSFAMNRDYDGITVLCHDGQWYVIQRKGKTTGGGGGGYDGPVPLANISGRWVWTSADDGERVITGDQVYGPFNYFQHDNELGNTNLKVYSASHVIDSTNGTMAAWGLFMGGIRIPTTDKKVRVDYAFKLQNAGTGTTWGFSVWSADLPASSPSSSTVTVTLRGESGTETSQNNSNNLHFGSFTTTSAIDEDYIIVQAENRGGSLFTTTYIYGQFSVYLVD